MSFTIDNTSSITGYVRNCVPRFAKHGVDSENDYLSTHAVYYTAVQCSGARNSAEADSARSLVPVFR